MDCSLLTAHNSKVRYTLWFYVFKASISNKFNPKNYSVSHIKYCWTYIYNISGNDIIFHILSYEMEYVKVL